MTPPTILTQEAENALAAFLEGLPESSAVTVRTLAHAWASGGGALHVGKVAMRLTSGGDPPFTAATVHGPRGDGPHPTLELCRVILQSHGVDHAQWVHWTDEFADLAHHGFDPSARFPTLPIGPDLSAAEVARLATGLRDLAVMAGA